MTKLRWTGLVLFALAVFSWLAETILYGSRIDEDGFLQESFFLPLGFILGFLALALLLVDLLSQWISRS